RPGGTGVPGPPAFGGAPARTRGTASPGGALRVAEAAERGYGPAAPGPSQTAGQPVGRPKCPAAGPASPVVRPGAAVTAAGGATRPLMYRPVRHRSPVRVRGRDRSMTPRSTGVGLRRGRAPPPPPRLRGARGGLRSAALSVHPYTQR